MTDSTAGNSRRIRARLFISAALPAFILYWITLAPTVTSEDSGELITAAYTLGIAHPPGYPLWCILAKVFTLLPVGSVAYRVNLLSACLGALAVGVLALLALRFTRSFWPSLLAALLFAASRDFWSQAVIAEVYTLNLLITLLLLLFLIYFDDTLRTRWLYAAASTLGIGLTNHSTLGPLSLVFLAWVFLRQPSLLRRPVFVANLLIAFLLGLSIILYLPMRSLTDPVMDWGNPETLSSMMDHLSRKQYEVGVEARPRTVIGQATLLFHFLETFSAQFTPIICILVLLGCREHMKRERPTFLLLLVVFGMTSYGFIWLLNYIPDRQNLHLTQVFFLPAFGIAAIWIAMAFARISRWVEDRFASLPRLQTLAIRGSGVLILAQAAFSHFEANDKSQCYLAEDWGRNILNTLKPNAIIIPTSDHSTFPILYLQTVEGLRPDVLIADKYGYIEDRVYRALFDGKETPRVPPPFGGSPVDGQRYLIQYSGRPVYLTTKAMVSGVENFELVTSGLVFEAVIKGTKPGEAEHVKLWESFQFHPGSLGRRPGDFSLDIISADYHYARARYALLFSRDAEAFEEARLAELYGDGIKEFHNNIGGMLAEAGKHEAALQPLLRSVQVDPDYDLAIRNLANAYFCLQRYREGLRWFNGALAVEPGNPLARLGKARAHKKRGEAVEAYGAYMRVFSMSPESETLQQEIKDFVKAAFGKDSPLAELPKARQTESRESRESRGEGGEFSD